MPQIACLAKHSNEWEEAEANIRSRTAMPTPRTKAEMFEYYNKLAFSGTLTQAQCVEAEITA